MLVTNVGDGFPSLRDGRRSRARHAQAGDVGAQRGCPTWVPNVLVRNVGDGRPSLGDGRPSRARPADTHLCFPWMDAHTDQARYCSSPLTATVCHSTVEERLPGMGKVAGSNPAGTRFPFFVQLDLETGVQVHMSTVHFVQWMHTRAADTFSDIAHT